MAMCGMSWRLVASLPGYTALSGWGGEVEMQMQVQMQMVPVPVSWAFDN